MQEPISDLKKFLDATSKSPPDPNSIRLEQFVKTIPFNTTIRIDLDDCRSFKIIIDIIFEAVSTISALAYVQKLLDDILKRMSPVVRPEGYVILLNFILSKLEKERIESQSQFDELLDSMPANIDSASFAAFTCWLLNLFSGGTTDDLFNRILGKMPKNLTPADYTRVIQLCVERPQISRPPLEKILERMPAEIDSKNYTLIVVKLLNTQVSQLNNTDILILLNKMPESISAGDYTSVFVTLGSLINKLPDEYLINNLDAIFGKMPKNMSPDNFWNVFFRLIGKDEVRKTFASKYISDGTIYALNQMPAGTNTNINVYIKHLLQSLSQEQLAKITNEHVKALSPDIFNPTLAPPARATHKIFARNPKNSSTTETSDESTGDGSDNSSSGSGDDGSGTDNSSSRSGSSSDEDGSGSTSSSEDESKKDKKPPPIVVKKTYLGKPPSSSFSSSETDSADKKPKKNTVHRTIVDPADKPRDVDRGASSRKNVDPVPQLEDETEAGRGMFSHQTSEAGRNFSQTKTKDNGYKRDQGKSTAHSDEALILDEVDGLYELNQKHQTSGSTRKVIRYLTGSWFLFCINSFLNFFFRLSTQLIIAALSLSIGLIIMKTLPQVAAIVPEVFLGIAMVAPIVGLLAQIVISCIEYAKWNGSTRSFLRHQLSFFTPRTNLGKMFTTLCVLSCGALIGVAIAFFLGNVDCVQALTPFFNVVHDFLVQGLTHIFSAFGLSDIVITAEAANIVGAIFLTTLPLFALEISRRVSNMVHPPSVTISYEDLETEDIPQYFRYYDDKDNTSNSQSFSGPLSEEEITLAFGEEPTLEQRQNAKGVPTPPINFSTN